MSRAEHRSSIAALALAALAAAAAAQAPGSLAAPREALFHQDVVWSPDGEWLAFSEYAGGEEYSPERWGIHRVEVATGERQEVIGNALWVSFSPDGERLAFSSGRGGNWDVYTAALDGSDVRRLTDDPAKDHIPAFSPDGGRIAFCSNRFGQVDLYVMDATGGDLRRVTDDPAHDYNPVFSPDGESLVFYREKGDGKDQIWMVELDGGVERGLTADEANNIFPGFAPNGDIVFTADSGEAKMLVRIDDEGRHATRIGDVEAFFARVSPDGTRVAFIAGSWPRSAIYLMNAVGGEIRKIVN